MSNTKTKAKATDKKTNRSVKDKTTFKIEDVLNPTAEGRIKKMENFKLLAEKYHFLINKKNDLETFKVSSDGLKEKITLSNSNGYRLEVSNSQVVEEVLFLITEKLNLFLKKSEKEILEYSI